MKGLDNEGYIIMLIISNVVAILQLVAAVKWSRIALISFAILFAWASWVNWRQSQQNPQVYMGYADLTWSAWYSDFINGWFAKHTKLAVGFIATCQGLIAISFLFKGWVFRIGAVGAIIFLISILPFGVGSGFPCTAIMAIAVFVLLRKNSANLAWKKNQKIVTPA